ncbi:MAG: hypothetical protein F6J94_29120 [Moorea sp. SIO1F2]|uniref:hypothetical protein n=1 Tax=unclassified Moorena TaxID=2683338 RepID=UPI0013B7016B|nr:MULTISPECIES: hypothetical protein [unclassified Moorena]NEO00494.1 hypothetical protein [Moorena sp. SIO3I7]NEO47520.1 hypothetical protein [Moorena sp. SIO4A3]NEO94022.1 hypothetical protein [Moorena sp. SIO3G5]NEO09159.1 hypothetical protein [Moorena sp. SIO3I8]NET85804.1 hypothetical protein [Moorena sp. SIO1F2]
MNHSYEWLISTIGLVSSLSIAFYNDRSNYLLLKKRCIPTPCSLIATPYSLKTTGVST